MSGDNEETNDVGTITEDNMLEETMTEETMDESTELDVIEDKVLSSIIRQAASGVKGVDKVNTTPFLKNAASRFTGNKSTGVNVMSGENQVLIEIGVSVVYGSSIPNIMREVRRDVTKAVEEMCGKEVLQVKVTATDIVMDNASIALASANANTGR